MAKLSYKVSYYNVHLLCADSCRAGNVLFYEDTIIGR